MSTVCVGSGYMSANNVWRNDQKKTAWFRVVRRVLYVEDLCVEALP